MVASLAGGTAALILRTAESTTKKVFAEPAGSPIQIRVAAPGTFFAGHTFAPYYVVPSDEVPSPADLSESERSDAIAFRDFDWAESKGAVAGSPAIVRLQLRAKGDEPIVVNALRVNVVQRTAPVEGWFVAKPGCGPEPVRVATVDLDDPNPTVEYQGTQGPQDQLTLSVTRTDVELIELHASTRTATVDWTVELFYSGPDGDGSVLVDDGDGPFRVTTETASEGYRPTFGESEGFEREATWDDGVVAC